MNFLSAVLPAVRHIRTPAAVGTLWGLVLVIVTLPHWSRLSTEPDIARFADLVAKVPSVYRLAALGFGVYLLGVIAIQFQSFLGRRLGRMTRRLVGRVRDWIPYSPKRFEAPARNVRTRLYRLSEALRVEPPSVRTPVLDALSAVYARAGAPGAASLTVPMETLFERLEATSMQLSEAAPTQAQEYDRLRSEAEFRGGVAVALGVLVGLVLWQVWPPLIVISLLITLALGWQAHLLRLRAKELLALSLHLGYTKIPMLEVLYSELARRKPDDRASEGTWAGVTAVALDRVGEIELSNYSLHEFLDMEPPDSVVEDARAYLAEHDPDSAELLDRLVKRRAGARTDSDGAG